MVLVSCKRLRQRVTQSYVKENKVAQWHAQHIKNEFEVNKTIITLTFMLHRHKRDINITQLPRTPN